MAILIAGFDIVLRGSTRENLHDVPNFLHPLVSRPDGPRLPFVFTAANFFQGQCFHRNRRIKRQIPIFQIVYYVSRTHFLIAWVILLKIIEYGAVLIFDYNDIGY